MMTGPQGIALVKQFEGCRLSAYLDSVGIPTIGVGHIHGVSMGDTITQDEADELLHGDLLITEEYVTKAVWAPLLQEEFDALVSLVFNIGGGAFQKSTLLRKLNAMDYDGAADAFLSWDKAGGNVIPGLARRRAAERELFLA